MTRRSPIFAVLTLLVLPAWSLAADGPGSQPRSQAAPGAVFGDVQNRLNDPSTYCCPPPRFSDTDVRFGWWAAWFTGSQAKTGEWQDWNPSPFWDVDTLQSDGRRTLDLTATGTDSETTRLRAGYYQGNGAVKLDYNRYIHRLDHDPMNNMTDVNPATNPGGYATALSAARNPKIVKEDISVGEDYALRVQEIKSTFKLKTSDDMKVRLDLWGLQKSGLRQANAEAMCYNAPGTAAIPPDHLGPGGAPFGPMGAARCHVLSQAQRVEYTTLEIKPVIELHLGDSIVVEYSRPMRGFNASDGFTAFSDVQGRFYDRTGVLSYPAANGGMAELYGVVPSNYLQMDQLKISGDVFEDTKFYSYLMVGNNTSQDRTTDGRPYDMTRWFNNMDLRLTNTSIENVSLTGYGKIYNDFQRPADLGATVGPGGIGGNTPLSPSQTAVIANRLVQNSNYERITSGLNGVWRPYGRGFGLGGLAIVGGYEYGDYERQLDDFNPNTNPPTFLFSQAHTITNSFQVGPSVRWSEHFDSYLRYKFQAADQPLMGVQGQNALTNTLLPVTDNIVEVGATWVPTDRFMLNSSIGIEYAENHTQYANFDEENYPFTINGWYAATDRLSFTGGYAILSNFVAQNIAAADQLTYAGPGTAAPPLFGRWSYGGRSEVWNFGSRYQLTERVRLTGDAEFIWGHNLITSSNFVTTGVPSSDIGGYSEVLNRTTRISTGADWTLAPRVITYVRYEVWDFLDQAPGYETGTAHGILGGLTAIF